MPWAHDFPNPDLLEVSAFSLEGVLLFWKFFSNCVCFFDKAFTRAGTVSAIYMALPVQLTFVSPSPHKHKPLPLSYPEVSQLGSVVCWHGIHGLACITCCSFLVSCQQFVFSEFLLHMLCEVAGSHDFITDLVVISLKASVSTVIESSGFPCKNSCDAQLFRTENMNLKG